MRLAVAMTVNDRPIYLRQTLNSWARTRGLQYVDFHFGVEPGPEANDNLSAITQWAQHTGVDATVRINPEKFGGQHNPWETLHRAFLSGAEYTILAEDDLLVSTDILEYHRWASETFPPTGHNQDDGVTPENKTALVCSFTEGPGTYTNVVHEVEGFASVLVWGTWRRWWDALISPTWDHNYSTGSGLERGWDWNLNRRVMVPRHLTSVQPDMSRVQNIGAVGTHSPQGAGYIEAKDWQPSFPYQLYELS